MHGQRGSSDAAIIAGLLAAVLVIALLVSAAYRGQERESERLIADRCGPGAERVLDAYRDWQGSMLKPRAVVVACDRPGREQVSALYDQQTEARQLCGHDRATLITKDVRHSKTTQTFAVLRCDR